MLLVFFRIASPMTLIRTMLLKRKYLTLNTLTIINISTAFLLLSITPYVMYYLSLVVRKSVFLHMAKTKTQISCTVTAQLISAFVFAIWIVQSLYYLNPKFQASCHLLWLYSPVFVGPSWKPRRSIFSQRGSFNVLPADESGNK